MARIAPLSLDQVTADLTELIELSRRRMGFQSNDIMTMARMPELLRSFSPLVRAIYAPGAVSFELKKMIALVTSTASSCRYCRAHTAHGIGQSGGSSDKLARVWLFASDPAFSPAERAALAVAQGAGHAPVDVTDEDFAELKRHYADEQIIEITAVIALFGFLNKWNALLETDLEAVPRSFVESLGLQRP